MTRAPAHPLLTTLEILDQVDPDDSAFMFRPVGPEWLSCRQLLTDPDHLGTWQRQIHQRIADDHDAPTTAVARAAAGTLLDWYANISASLVGAAFHVDRRVPSVAPHNISFRRHRVGHWVSGVGVHSPKFWCLPDDPAAHHRDARMVSDVDVLAHIARAQVHAHATEFLAVFDPGVRLPRRSLLGAFFDALDTAAWNAERLPGHATPVETSALLLPGDPMFPPSRMRVVIDEHGNCQVTHRRIGCCETFRVEGPCTTCTRANL